MFVVRHEAEAECRFNATPFHFVAYYEHDEAVSSGYSFKVRVRLPKF